jgi:hypothetical protein
MFKAGILGALLLSGNAFASTSLDISHDNLQSYDIVTAKCAIAKDDSVPKEVDATIDSGTADIVLKNGTKISIDFYDVVGRGYADAKDSASACADARAQFFADKTVKWLINLLDSVQEGKIEASTTDVCSEPVLRIYDSTRLTDIPYADIDTDEIPVACPK